MLCKTRKLTIEEQLTLLKNAVLSSDSNQDFSTVQELIATYEVPVDSCLTTRGETALMLAAKQCKLNIMNYLIRKGANPNKPDYQGNTCVIYCIRSMKTNVLTGLRLLFDNKANFVYKNTEGKKPIDYLELYHNREEDYEELQEAFHEFTSSDYEKLALIFMFKKQRIHLL